MSETQPGEAKGLPQDLSVENFKVCRELIVENIRIMERNETYVVGAVAAIIGFGIAQQDRTIFIIHALVAAVVVALGALRFAGLHHVIQLGDEYSRIVEKELATKVRWATYYQEHTHGTLGKSRLAFWIVLGLLIAFYLGYCICHGPFHGHCALKEVIVPGDIGIFRKESIQRESTPPRQP